MDAPLNIHFDSHARKLTKQKLSLIINAVDFLCASSTYHIMPKSRED